MSIILQVDFKFEGPFGSTMASAFQELASGINQEEGFKMKVWTENEANGEAGGIYFFEDERTAQQYWDMHSKRLASFGVHHANAKIFHINKQLSELNHFPI
ncbi:monooxygenase [Paenibacillus sp. FSL R10-2782]|uniref:Monooxygenase n=1 Tax=Paenibacillus terrae TaxID=159743 RepID=A0A4U2PZ10_9BACL|nr:monooxygenase [Paenibacillus terrae]TKH45102.1 monooxygenase [Paenibacillus terrae]